VEEHFFGDEIPVDELVGKKVRAGDGYRTSEGEVFVQEDYKKFVIS
jgi:hypothetical protein